MEFLIEMRVNDGDKVWTQDICSDSMVNHHSSQKFKLLGKDRLEPLRIALKYKAFV